MLRVALIAYLSLTTVFGPAVCCCNARQFVSLVEGSNCCGRTGAQPTESETVHHHHHQHGHAHHQHEHSSATSKSESEQAPAQNEHDDEDCPCGKHHASLVAAAVSGGGSLKAVEPQTQTWFVLVAPLPALPDYDAAKASRNAHRRPAGLYGRQMLRAYSIMRC